MHWIKRTVANRSLAMYWYGGGRNVLLSLRLSLSFNEPVPLDYELYCELLSLHLPTPLRCDKIAGGGWNYVFPFLYMYGRGGAQIGFFPSPRWKARTGWCWVFPFPNLGQALVKVSPEGPPCSEKQNALAYFKMVPFPFRQKPEGIFLRY